jgi:hypothetical protein
MIKYLNVFIVCSILGNVWMGPIRSEPNSEPLFVETDNSKNASLLETILNEERLDLNAENTTDLHFNIKISVRPDFKSQELFVKSDVIQSVLNETKKAETFLNEIFEQIRKYVS